MPPIELVLLSGRFYIILSDQVTIISGRDNFNKGTNWNKLQPSVQLGCYVILQEISCAFFTPFYKSDLPITSRIQIMRLANSFRFGPFFSETNLIYDPFVIGNKGNLFCCQKNRNLSRRIKHCRVHISCFGDFFKC